MASLISESVGDAGRGMRRGLLGISWISSGCDSRAPARRAGVGTTNRRSTTFGRNGHSPWIIETLRIGAAETGATDDIRKPPATTRVNRRQAFWHDMTAPPSVK